MLKTYNLIDEGFDIEVSAEVIKGDDSTRDYQGTPDTVQIFQVWVEGFDVTKNIDIDREERLKELILNK